MGNTFGWDFAGNNQDFVYNEIIDSVSKLFEVKSMFGFSWLSINFCNDQNEWTLNQIIFFKLPIVVWDLHKKSNIHLGRYQFSIVGMIQYSRQRLEPSDFFDFDGKVLTENSWQALLAKEVFWLISYWKILNQLLRIFLSFITKLDVWDWY